LRHAGCAPQRRAALLRLIQWGIRARMQRPGRSSGPRVIRLCSAPVVCLNLAGLMDRCLESQALQTILDLCRNLPAVDCEPGATLLSEGEHTGILYILIDGRIEIVKGAFQVYVTSEPGSMFGEISALLNVPHTATVKALTACRLHLVSDARTFLRSRPDLAFCLSRLLAQRLQSVTSYLVDLKCQFEDRHDHLGMVDEVLHSILHQQDEVFQPGSDRCPDAKI
jgi:CRP/FNR family transcriptional regulator, cyclic AMP receptor protein